jgi:hypothetical protein
MLAVEEIFISICNSTEKSTLTQDLCKLSNTIRVSYIYLPLDLHGKFSHQAFLGYVAVGLLVLIIKVAHSRFCQNKAFIVNILDTCVELSDSFAVVEVDVDSVL